MMLSTGAASVPGNAFIFSPMESFNPCAISCAFCSSMRVASGGALDGLSARRSTFPVSFCTTSQALPSSFLGIRRPTLRGISAWRWYTKSYVVVAGLLDDGGNEERDSKGGDGFRPYSAPRRKVGRSRRASWEDIQWSNVPRKEKARRSVPSHDDLDEDEEGYISGNGHDSKKREHGRKVRHDGEDLELSSEEDREWRRDRRREEDEDYMDSHEINYIDDRRPSGRRGQRIEDPNYRHAEQPPPPWNSEWFDDARRTDQGGAFSLVKSFYDSLFWYGAVYRDEGELPAMNFKDLMEQFSTGSIWSRSAWRDPRSSTSRAIAQPEALGAEQIYRWRPARPDDEADRSRPRRGQRSSTGGGDGRGRAARQRGRGVSSPSSTSGRRDFLGASGSDRYDYADAREEIGQEEEVAGRRRRGRREREDVDVVAVERLRRKQRQFADREHTIEMDLEKVRERLGVVDATVELWMRRSAAMKARGSSETDIEMLQAKRRIYGLKDEGRRLDSARSELESRLEDCRLKLDRILEELEKLGEDAEPFMYYESQSAVRDGSGGSTGFPKKDVTVSVESDRNGGNRGGDDGPTEVFEVVMRKGRDGLGMEAEERDLEPAIPLAEEVD